MKNRSTTKSLSIDISPVFNQENSPRKFSVGVMTVIFYHITQ